MSEVQELSGIIVKSSCYCLNQHPSFPFTNLFVGDETLYLKSDVDHDREVLYVFCLTDITIISLYLNQYNRLTAISLKSPGDESSPTVMKLFTNLQNPGFSDVEDQEPAQVLVLGPEDYGRDNKLTLKVVRFQNVNSISIFIEENAGEEFSVLSGLKIYGVTLDGLNVGAIHELKHDH